MTIVQQVFGNLAIVMIMMTNHRHHNGGGGCGVDAHGLIEEPPSRNQILWCRNET